MCCLVSMKLYYICCHLLKVLQHCSQIEHTKLFQYFCFCWKFLCFRTQYVIYFRETSIGCWVEHIYFCVRVKYYVDIYYVHMMSLHSDISCLSFCLYGLSIGGHLNLNFLLLLGCANLCHEAQYYGFFFFFNEIGCTRVWCIYA